MPAALRRWGVGLASMVVIVACSTSLSERRAPNDPQMPDPRLMDRTGALDDDAPVLIRGRIPPSPAELVMEPVFRIGTPSSPSPMAQGGRHRLRGFDDEGAILFDVRFDGAQVSHGVGGFEEHFTFILPLGTGGASRLERIELETGDGRRAARTATHSVTELHSELEREDILTIRSEGGGRARVTWNAEIFPAIMVRDSETGTILAFAQGGETTVFTERAYLEVTFSDGIRSAARLFPIGPAT